MSTKCPMGSVACFDIADFLQLSMEYLRDLTVGTYQVRLAPS